MPAYSIKEYKSLPAPETVWIWEGILPVSGSALLFGNPKLGKSFLSLGLAEAVADPSIDSYLGQRVLHHGRVLYIQLDTPRSLWLLQYIPIVGVNAEESVFIIDKEVPDRPNPFDLSNLVCQKWLRAEVERLQPVLVIVDTMRRMHLQDENDPTTATKIFEIILGCTAPAAVLLLTHKKKQQHGDNSLGTARGSTAFTGAVDAIINMTKTALHFEARSNIDDELPIMQRDNGSWALNSQDEEIREFISKLNPNQPKGNINKAIMDEFNVSLATAKRWRSSYKPIE